MGQADKVWSMLATPLVDRTEKWWGSVMDVGLDPELTKWSVRLGPAIVLTGKGYKEHHWLVVPPSTTSVISSSFLLPLISSCRCPLALSLVLKTSMAGAAPLSVSVVKPGVAPTPVGRLLLLCSMKRVIA